MTSWNCSDRRLSPSNVVSATEHGCVPPSMCAGMQPHRCVLSAGGGAWSMDHPASPRPVVGPCPQALVAGASFCPPRHVNVQAAPYVDASETEYCRASRFATSVTTDRSPCCTSAASQEPCYNSGMFRLLRVENTPTTSTKTTKNLSRVLVRRKSACCINFSSPGHRDLNSLDFVVNRFFVKLFQTSDIDIVKCCQSHFCFDLPSVVHDRRARKFDLRYRDHSDPFCQMIIHL